MRRTISLITAGVFLFLSSLQAQTTCSDDRVAYVNSKNVGGTGAYTISIGAEEKAAQTYHYSGPGVVSGARVYGTVPGFLGVALQVSVYNVDANGRPKGSALRTAPIQGFYPWSAAFFDVSFSPAVSVSSNFAIVVEILNFPGAGHSFLVQYTGNGEGNGEDLASLAGTSTGGNWASAKDAFVKDGDFYIYPRMTNFNTPLFSAPSCISTGTNVGFINNTEMTTDPMFNTITAAGYTGGKFLYSWDFGDGSPVSHLPNPSHVFASAGAYNVTLTTTIDGWDVDCIKTYTKTISVGLTASATSIVNVSCNGGSNGSVIAAKAGGAKPFTYSINDETYQNGTSFTGLTAKDYTLYVKDSLGCVASTSFTVTQPAAIVFSSVSTTNASCGKSDGGILVATTGGVSPVQYRLNSGSFQSSGKFDSLAAGPYTITAKDANGCTNSAVAGIKNFGGPAFSVLNSTNVSCFGGNDGTISLSSLGGTGAIKYSIDGGTTFQSSGNFSNVTAGNYFEIVKDAAGCTDVKVVTINQPEAITLTVSSVPLSCFESGDGQINVTSTSGGTGSFSYSIDGVNYQSGKNFSGLSASTYTVYAKDVSGCVKSTSVLVSQPTALTATVTSTSTGCYGYQNGSLRVFATGGTPEYVYGIGDDTYFQSSNTFNNLAAGTYPLVVNDANGCVYTLTGTVTQPTPIVAVATPTNSTCGNSNGGILVTATGGSGAGYTYSLNGGAYGVGSFSGLTANTYVITAKDNTGCFSTTNVTIFDANGPSISTINHTNVNCNGGNDGSITVGTVSGGTGTIQYSINGTTFQVSPVFNNLPAGTYNVTVKDAVGCTGNGTVSITEPSAFVITTSIVNELCNGSSTGSVTLLVGGGNGTLAYSINGGSSYQSSKVFSNLPAGTYTIIVKDAGGCLGYVNARILEPNPITATYSSLNVTCHGARNGTIYVTARGGTGALKYSLTGSSYQTSTDFTGLPGGSYNIYVKDANGCVKVFPASVYEPATLTATANVSNVTCYGGNNGVVDLSVSGGTPAYKFAWSNGPVTEDNFNLPIGNYGVSVTDANGCSVSKSYPIAQPATPLIVNGTVTNSTASNGAIDITATGGVGGFKYLWNTGAVTPDLTGLVPGVYSVVVTDANGCAASSTFVVGGNVGIATLETVNAQVSVYPNPAKDYFVVEVKGFNIDKIELYDVLGRLMSSAEPKNSKTEINTSDLAQGMYLVRILVDGKLITKRIKIIQ